jgi:hypothetical protein
MYVDRCELYRRSLRDICLQLLHALTQDYQSTF